MATITTETNSILNDTRGEAVRDSFVSACQKINQNPQLPTVSTSDKNKVLTVNSSGEWEALAWQT